MDWEELTSFENLWLSYRKAARGKRSQPEVADFELRLVDNLIFLQDELRGGAYYPGTYRNFYVREAKRRLISAAPFRDRVVHHALVRQLEPVYERKFIFDTYANRVGKGTHAAIARCTQYLRRFGYFLFLDVEQFFPSIDHQILKDILRKTIHEPRILHLAGQIIDGGAGIHTAKGQNLFFAGDDLLSCLRPRGLPIGNLTSQFWANVYLNDFDHFIKRTLGCRGYVRYVDDMLLFSNSKHQLQVWLNEIIRCLEPLRLKLHLERAQVYPSSHGVGFLGFQVYPDFRRLKRRNALRARSRLLHIAAAVNHGDATLETLSLSLRGWIGHAQFGDTFGLRERLVSLLPAIRITHAPN